MKDRIRQLQAQAQEIVLDGIWVPNNLLPEWCHDEREGGRTLRRAVAKANAMQAQARKDSREKKDGAMRQAIIADYADQVGKAGKNWEGEINYNVDEDRQYRALCAFAACMAEKGLIDLDDDEE